MRKWKLLLPAPRWFSGSDKFSVDIANSSGSSTKEIDLKISLDILGVSVTSDLPINDLTNESAIFIDVLMIIPVDDR